MSTFGITFKDNQGREINPKFGVTGVTLNYIEHLERQVAELTKQLAVVQASYLNHVHSAGCNAIELHKDSMALNTILTETFQAGRDSYQKELSDTNAALDASRRRELELLAVIEKQQVALRAMAEDGWLYFGVEGMSEAQQLLADALRITGTL